MTLTNFTLTYCVETDLFKFGGNVKQELRTDLVQQCLLKNKPTQPDSAPMRELSIYTIEILFNPNSKTFTAIYDTGNKQLRSSLLEHALSRLP